MTEVLRLSWSIAQSGWRATWNRMFRFSKVKSGLIWLLIQGLTVLLVARRAPALAADSAQTGLMGAATLIALQMGWFGLMFGFARGQMQLYQGLLVPLFQISPARPLAFLLGRVLEAVPQRLWTTLLWSWAYSAIIPGPARWPAVGFLFLTGLASGMVAHLAGLLLLAFWSRFHPQSMRHGNFLFGGLTLALVTWAMVYLASGGTATDLALVMRRHRTSVFTLLVLTGGLPGLLLIGGLLIRPGWVEGLYRSGLYRVMELGEQDFHPPGRSRWLSVAIDGVYRAVLSREWLQLARSTVARIQLMAFLVGTVGVFFIGRAMVGEPVERVVQFVGALSLFGWFMVFGHWVVRVFEQERVTIALYRLAAVPTHKLVAAKLISISLPSAILVGAATLAGAVAAQLPPAAVLRVLIWSELALVAGVMGGFGAAAATADQEPEEPDACPAGRSEMASATTAQSSAWFSLFRTLSVVVSVALPLWAGADRPGLGGSLPPAVAWVIAFGLPALLLVGGVGRMLRTWRTDG